VIGGGSGGSGVCKRAAGYGKKVCVVERGVAYVEGVRKGAGFGGTCVNVGCVPKKLMFSAAAVRESITGPAEIATGYGFGEAKAAVGEMLVDWSGLKARRDAYVERLNTVYESGWQGLGVDVVVGRAMLKEALPDKTLVEIAMPDGSVNVVSAEHVVIAVGGEPSLPDVPGSELGITSDGFFDLAEQPKKCAVFGAGYIAVEMAGILEALGTDTTLFCRGSKVLRNDKVFDSDITDTLMKEITKHGPTLQTGAEAAGLQGEADGTISITLKDGSLHTGYDTVMWAIGRHPVTEGLGLEQCAVETTATGFIKVDDYENTSAPNIYAIGDATTAGWELTPVAIAAGRRLADRLFGGEEASRFIYRDIATVIFSHPPIGTIGFTEAAAAEHFGAENISVRKASFGSMLYAFNPDAEHKVQTTLKLVLHGPEEIVVGLHMIGPYSDEMLQGFAVAVKMGATRRDFEATCAIHPTIAEEFVTFGGWGQKDGKPDLPPQLKPANLQQQVAILREENAALKAENTKLKDASKL